MVEPAVPPGAPEHVVQLILGSLQFSAACLRLYGHPGLLRVAAGSERLPDAVPLICAPGDVAICNRQALHGSFANTSDKPRVTINFGFHRRASVLGVTSGGVHNPVSVYDEQRIHERSRLIGLAIDARRQRFPDEQPFRYVPFAGMEDRYRWTPAAQDRLKDYNLLDLGI